MIHVVSASVVGLLASLFVTQSAGHSAEPLSSRSRGFLLALLRLALASVLVAAILVTGSALGAYPLAPAWQGGRWLDLLVAGLAALALLALSYRPSALPGTAPEEAPGPHQLPDSAGERLEAQRTRAACSTPAAGAARGPVLPARALPTSTPGAIKFTCPRCGYLSKVPARYAGVAARCTGCREPLRVPSLRSEGRPTEPARRARLRPAPRAPRG